MRAHLMFADADFDLARELPAHAADVERDLDLPTVYAAMARGDEFLHGVARRGLLSQLTDPAAIAYRQHVLADCLAAPEVTRELYGIAVEAVERERKFWMGTRTRYPGTILHRSIEVLQMFNTLLHRLREIAETRADRFASDGFRGFFAMLVDQLSDDYFADARAHLKTLKFRGGVLLGARVGKGNKGTRYVLRTPVAPRRRLGDMLHGRSALSALSFTVPDQDEAGQQSLAELRDRGINLVADAMARSTDHILGFFRLLRAELGFYVGCLNLHETLVARGATVVQPQAVPAGDQWGGSGLYDVALALAVDPPVVGNDVAADGKGLIVITGANRGGKSTFLRSVGLAQLMMQAGMFVPATAFRASAVTGVFTHFKREEDATMRSGKLDEELARMSEIADHIRPGGLLLCNESFASTNEREGAEISRQIIGALLESGVRVCFVTHLYDLSQGLYRQRRADTLFLRAPRDAQGHRSFRLEPGEPLPTSFGADVYARVFHEPGTRGMSSRSSRPPSGGTRQRTSPTDRMGERVEHGG